MSEPEDKFITLRIPADTHEELTQLAKDNDRTIAAEVRLAIRDRLLLVWEARQVKDAT